MCLCHELSKSYGFLSEKCPNWVITWQVSSNYITQPSNAFKSMSYEGCQGIVIPWQTPKIGQKDAKLISQLLTLFRSSSIPWNQLCTQFLPIKPSNLCANHDFQLMAFTPKLWFEPNLSGSNPLTYPTPNAEINFY